MANEIIGVSQLKPDGTESVQMAYVFPISPRIEDEDGNEVPVPFPITRAMPPFMESELDPDVLNSIRAGDAGWMFRDIEKSAGESDAAFLTRVRADYDVVTAYALAQRRDQAVEAGIFDRRRFQVDR